MQSRSDAELNDRELAEVGRQKTKIYNPLMPSLPWTWQALVGDSLGQQWHKSKAHDALWDTFRTAEVYEATL